MDDNQQPTSSPMRFDRYEIVQRLGGGAYGSVWTVNDTATTGETRKAIKFLWTATNGELETLLKKSNREIYSRPEPYPNNPSAEHREQFKTEIRILTVLGNNHPAYIPKFYDSNMDSYPPYIVMEVVDYTPIEKLMAQSDSIPVISEVVALEVSRRMLTVLQTLHESEKRYLEDIQLKNYCVDLDAESVQTNTTDFAMKILDWNGTLPFQGSNPTSFDINSVMLLLYQMLTGVDLTPDRRKKPNITFTADDLRARAENAWQQISPTTQQLLVGVLSQAVDTTDFGGTNRVIGSIQRAINAIKPDTFASPARGATFTPEAYMRRSEYSAQPRREPIFYANTLDLPQYRWYLIAQAFYDCYETADPIYFEGTIRPGVIGLLDSLSQDNFDGDTWQTEADSLMSHRAMTDEIRTALQAISTELRLRQQWRDVYHKAYQEFQDRLGTGDFDFAALSAGFAQWNTDSETLEASYRQRLLGSLLIANRRTDLDNTSDARDQLEKFESWLQAQQSNQARYQEFDATYQSLQQQAESNQAVANLETTFFNPISQMIREDRAFPRHASSIEAIARAIVAQDETQAVAVHGFLTKIQDSLPQQQARTIDELAREYFPYIRAEKDATSIRGYLRHFAGRADDSRSSSKRLPKVLDTLRDLRTPVVKGYFAGLIAKYIRETRENLSILTLTDANITPYIAGSTVRDFYLEVVAPIVNDTDIPSDAIQPAWDEFNTYYQGIIERYLETSENYETTQQAISHLIDLNQGVDEQRTQTLRDIPQDIEKLKKAYDGISAASLDQQRENIDTFYNAVENVRNKYQYNLGWLDTLTINLPEDKPKTPEKPDTVPTPIPDSDVDNRDEDDSYTPPEFTDETTSGGMINPANGYEKTSRRTAQPVNQSRGLMTVGAVVGLIAIVALGFLGLSASGILGGSPTQTPTPDPTQTAFAVTQIAFENTQNAIDVRETVNAENTATQSVIETATSLKLTEDFDEVGTATAMTATQEAATLIAQTTQNAAERQTQEAQSSATAFANQTAVLLEQQTQTREAINNAVATETQTFIETQEFIANQTATQNANETAIALTAEAAASAVAATETQAILFEQGTATADAANATQAFIAGQTATQNAVVMQMTQVAQDAEPNLESNIRNFDGSLNVLPTQQVVARQDRNNSLLGCGDANPRAFTIDAQTSFRLLDRSIVSGIEWYDVSYNVSNRTLGGFLDETCIDTLFAEQSPLILETLSLGIEGRNINVDTRIPLYSLPNMPLQSAQSEEQIVGRPNSRFDWRLYGRYVDQQRNNWLFISFDDAVDSDIRVYTWIPDTSSNLDLSTLTPDDLARVPILVPSTERILVSAEPDSQNQVQIPWSQPPSQTYLMGQDQETGAYVVVYVQGGRGTVYYYRPENDAFVSRQGLQLITVPTPFPPAPVEDGAEETEN